MAGHPAVIVHIAVKTQYPHGVKKPALKTKTVYQLERHTGNFKWVQRHGRRYAKTNASLVRVRYAWRSSSDEWAEIARHQMALFAARGMKNRNAKKRKRNPDRKDLRVEVPGWKQPPWHRLLAFYFHNVDNLTKLQFKKKEVDHVRKHPDIIDWRSLEIVDPQQGL